jgi:hypothetical protein
MTRCFKVGLRRHHDGEQLEEMQAPKDWILNCPLGAYLSWGLSVVQEQGKRPEIYHLWDEIL